MMELRSERDGAVTSITLNRPEVGNRITNDMAASLAAALDGAAASRAIILRGAGPDFCLGRDLPHPGPEQVVTAIDIRVNDTEPMLALFAAFRRSPVPIIGIVQGRVVGAACALAALCDITLATHNATFQLPELSRGIPPCLAMSALAQRVPRKAIMHLVYSGEPIDAHTALRIGLVSHVVPGGQLDGTASQFLDKLLSYGKEAAETVKIYMRSAPEIDPVAAADLASNIMATVMSSARRS